MSNIYVVINESLPLGTDNPISEVLNVGYSTIQGALDALADIGAENGVTLDDDSSTLSIPVEGTHLEFDEYWIQEIYVED